jgi:hypothetical protein
MEKGMQKKKENEKLLGFFMTPGRGANSQQLS